ncbi:VOC family protein [Dyadobacter chenwenxiniae]|uniref:VOC family protein n=1 Tax=Dyadobacter chenwenxiniae TaxID=2906456 RepID=UPI0021121D06|nr:VOC family protein [Dyadobacter chenwenxiniae]
MTNVDFYIQAFGAIELRRVSNSDGSIHVSELSIGGAIFHLHEETADPKAFCPKRHDGTTVTIGLFVADVDAVMNQASAAGGEVISPAQDYDYGYRQGKIRDPFGHIWMIEAEI